MTNYQHLSQKNQILKRPGQHIGSSKTCKQNVWLLKKKKIIEENITFNQGLIHIFYEVLGNAQDNYFRSKGTKTPLKKIEVNINKETGEISVLNDGLCIPTRIHKWGKNEEKLEGDLYETEIIFGQLNSSSNYDDNKNKRVGGGLHGVGVKLTNIFSKNFKVETSDKEKKFCGIWIDNMQKLDKREITKCSKGYTKVTYIADFERFGLKGYTSNMIKVMNKLCYDCALVTGQTIIFNDEKIIIKNLEDYSKLYFEEERNFIEMKTEDSNIILSEKKNLDSVNNNISFVNGIITNDGGIHVDEWKKTIYKPLIEKIQNKLKKKDVKISHKNLDKYFFIFLNCNLDNPEFGGQTKGKLNSPSPITNITTSKLNSLLKWDYIKEIETSLNLQDLKVLKKSDGKKTKRINGIPKLTDANFAGTKNSHLCTLILCEGDSAKSGIVSGLSKNDRNIYGIYPLKGKLMNVCDVSTKKIAENDEINHIKKIIGLESNKKYNKENINTLRYNNIMFMTDQDLDGSHIKALCINLFKKQWHDLFVIDNFICCMNTPIIKAIKGKNSICFFNNEDYYVWKNKNDINNWKIKYYKGLGTSTATEFKEYFSNKKIIKFNFSGNDCDDSLDLVFNKERANDRKKWLSNYKKKNVLEYSENIFYKDFINKDLIHYSKYDCERSIPNIMDGLKTSQRKILFSAFKRNLYKEIKVAQFSGYVSEHSSYHHGEMSLNKAIINMAQNYMGSNNINFLEPNGQFGTRIHNGKDSASERYIFTQLNNIVKSIFINNDFKVLSYINDDGFPVEPEFYVPIIPTILINGCKGIGTGFSTEILNHNPLDIIYYIKNKIAPTSTPSKLKNLMPFYKNFKGSILKINNESFLFKGCYDIKNKNTINVTELPIGLSTQDFKDNINALISNKNSLIKDIEDMSTDTIIDFTITFNNTVDFNQLENQISSNINGIEKYIKLFSTRKNTNMNLFNEKHQITKFKTVENIIDYFIPIRLDFYNKRKQYILKNLKYEINILQNKSIFIEKQCNNSLDLKNKSKKSIIDILNKNNFDIIDNDPEFKYLTSMPIYSLIKENIDKLNKDINQKLSFYNTLNNKSIENIWLDELNYLHSLLHKDFPISSLALL